MSNIVINNVVRENEMREVQTTVLNDLTNILKMSFGPNGSNTCIKKENALPRYTKDGHTIISAINYNGIIEQSIIDDISEITRHIVKTVGDGTTSAVILSNNIFNEIIGLMNTYNYRPNEITYMIKTVVGEINAEIKSRARELTLKDVYNISMISTNSNREISNIITKIYSEFGNSVFIDVSASIGEDTMIKSYNGMTLNTGYSDSCFITNTKNNTAEVDHPEVYFFEHPIDTKELGVYLDAILSRNIITPCNEGRMENIVPTVIFAPMISQDMSSTMDSLTAVLANTPPANKPPVCIITSYTDNDMLFDLAKLCGAKTIRKYIDFNTYKSDVEHGLAPTPDTIFNWAGKCDSVVAYSDKTVFIRPKDMYNEDGSYSNLYENMLSFLESEISKCVTEGENIRSVGNLKRRLHSLKSNMVELLIGGITQADRDATRDLVEDAVLNVRSAAENGVGYAANMSAFTVLKDMCDENGIDTSEHVESVVSYISSCLSTTHEENDDLHKNILHIIYNAYYELVECLFDPEGVSNKDIIDNFYNNGAIYNINEGKYDTNVVSSIMSDIVILDTVTRIITIMATGNQFIVPTAMHNIYKKIEE